MWCGYSLVRAHSPRSVCTLPSRCIHSPGSACGLSSLQMRSVHFLINVHTAWMGRWQGGEETGAVDAGKFPKVPPRVSFGGGSSCSILHLPLYKEWPVLSHSPPLQLNHRLSRSGSHTTRLSTLPSQHPGLVCLPLRPYSSPCDFKQPGLSWCCSSLVWQGREPLTRLSPQSPAAGLAGAGLGLQLPWSLCWSQGPFCI